MRIRNAILQAFCLMSFYTAKTQTGREIDSVLKRLPHLDDTTKFSAYLKVGTMYGRRGMADSSFFYLSKSLDLANKQKDILRQCSAKIYLGSSLIRQNKYEDALKLYFEALPVTQKKGLTTLEGWVQKDIGFIYHVQNRDKEAILFFREAERIGELDRDTLDMTSLYAFMSAALGKTGDTTMALSYADKGITMANGMLDNPALPKTVREMIAGRKLTLCYNSFHFLTQKSDFARIAKELESVSGIITAFGNPYQEFQMLILKSNIELKLGNHREARMAAEKASTLYRKESGDFGPIRDIYYLIATTSASLGEYPKAYHALDTFRIYNDSLFNRAQQEAIHSIEVKYETARKDEQIIALNKQKKVQRMMIAGGAAALLIVGGLLFFAVRSKKLQKKLMLKEQESQKAYLEQKLAELQQTALRAQMNPHFIFNSLNSVQRFIINNDIKGVNVYLSSFANLIRQTLENSGKPAISLKAELDYLANYIQVEQMRSDNHFEFDLKVSEDIDANAIYIPDMIIQPFVENSIKHGLAGSTEKKGLLKVSVSKKEKLIVEVEDNGDGIFSGRKLNKEEDNLHEPMGTAITQRRIETYNRLYEEKISLQVTDKLQSHNGGQGTNVRIEFPINSD